MSSSLLNCFIFVCKIFTCTAIFFSWNTHHWIREDDGREFRGLQLDCYDYGHLCYERTAFRYGIRFFYILALLNFTFELLNILFLCKRKRSRINLVLEELGILTIIIFILTGTLIIIIAFIVLRRDLGERLDWSFIVFFLSLILSIIDLICSLVRAVSYCRENSFRSNVITYTSNGNHEDTIHIQ